MIMSTDEQEQLSNLYKYRYLNSQNEQHIINDVVENTS